jgi:hypothetical protein
MYDIMVACVILAPIVLLPCSVAAMIWLSGK